MNETARRNHNLASLYDEYSFFADLFMKNGTLTAWRRMGDEYSRYTYLVNRPMLVNSRRAD